MRLPWGPLSDTEMLDKDPARGRYARPGLP